MANKSKIKIHSIQYENSDGELHVATVSKPDISKNEAIDNAPGPPTGDCTCGEERCFAGKKYICIADPFGDCVWCVTSERC
jgi:hypothetical protein